MLTDLKRLELPGQGIAYEAVTALADILPQLPSLMLLDLSRNKITEKGALRLLQAIESHPALKDVKLDGNPVPSWIRVRLANMLSVREEQRMVQYLQRGRPA